MPRFLQALQALAAGRAGRTVVVEEAPPSALAAAAGLVKQVVPDHVRSSLAPLLGDKSHSEVLFMTSVILAIFLFVIVLPAFEALFGDCDEDAAVPRKKRISGSSSLRMYRPGVGIVELDAEDLAKMAAASSRRSSTRSSGSYCSMETIEESEEEYELSEDEDETSHETKPNKTPAYELRHEATIHNHVSRRSQ